MKSCNKHARKDLADIALTVKSESDENCGGKCIKNMTECRNFHFKFLLLALILGSGLIFASCNKSTEKHVARGEEYLQKRRFEEAVMEFRTAADIDKTSAKAHWGLARAYENLGQFYESIDALRQVTELDANNLEAKVKLGNYYY